MSATPSRPSTSLIDQFRGSSTAFKMLSGLLVALVVLALAFVWMTRPSGEGASNSEYLTRVGQSHYDTMKSDLEDSQAAQAEAVLRAENAERGLASARLDLADRDAKIAELKIIEQDWEREKDGIAQSAKTITDQESTIKSLESKAQNNTQLKNQVTQLETNIKALAAENQFLHSQNQELRAYISGY